MSSLSLLRLLHLSWLFNFFWWNFLRLLNYSLWLLNFLRLLNLLNLLRLSLLGLNLLCSNLWLGLSWIYSRRRIRSYWTRILVLKSIIIPCVVIIPAIFLRFFNWSCLTSSWYHLSWCNLRWCTLCWWSYCRRRIYLLNRSSIRFLNRRLCLNRSNFLNCWRLYTDRSNFLNCWWLTYGILYTRNLGDFIDRWRFFILIPPVIIIVPSVIFLFVFFFDYTRLLLNYRWTLCLFDSSYWWNHWLFYRSWFKIIFWYWLKTISTTHFGIRTCRKVLDLVTSTRFWIWTRYTKSA